jgi:hypothetical protein
MPRIVVTIAAAMLFLAPIDSAADPLLFGGVGFGSPANRGAVLTVSEVTGAGSVVGPGGGPNAGLTGLAFDPFGALYGSATSNPLFDPAADLPTLVQLHPSTGTPIVSFPISFDGDPLQINDLAADPVTGALYGVSLDTSNAVSSLYTIDKSAGNATLLGSTGVIGVTIAFAADGTLYMTSATFMTGSQIGSFLHTVNPTTGAVLTTTPLALLPSGNLVHIGGLAVSPTDGTLFASGREATVAQKGDIYMLTPTGSVTLIGSTGAGEVGDLAFQAVPEPATVLLVTTGLAGLGAFRKRARRRRP